MSSTSLVVRGAVWATVLFAGLSAGLAGCDRSGGGKGEPPASSNEYSLGQPAPTAPAAATATVQVGPRAGHRAGPFAVVAPIGSASPARKA